MRFEVDHTWENKIQDVDETIIHITKKAENDIDATDITVVNKLDALPYPPAKRHNMVFDAFEDLKPVKPFFH